MIDQFPKQGGEKQPTFDDLKKQLREHIQKTVIKISELIPKARQAKEDAGRKIQDAMQQGLEGEPWRRDFIMRPEEKANLALMELSDDVQKEVLAHGIASRHISVRDEDAPIKALVNVLANGQLKGDFAPLAGGINQVVFADAPFILLSNRGEPLVEDVSDGAGGTWQKLKGLRTVLVNGQYEGIIEDLKKAFPWVSFRTADEINDAVFDKKDPPYKSYEDRIDEEARKKLK